MPKRRNIPSTASIAHATEGDARLHAPSAARNVDAIIGILKEHASQSGSALELASGTGQHVAAFAAALPGLTWQPTEIDQSRFASISAWTTAAELVNLVPPQHLDATTAGWSEYWPDRDLILAINVLHLISTPDAMTLISEAAHALTSNGCLILYGPFLRNGLATSDGDARFHASIQTSDPELGYKNDVVIVRLLREAGLGKVEIVDMPANNLSIIARRY